MIVCQGVPLGAGREAGQRTASPSCPADAGRTYDVGHKGPVRLGCWRPPAPVVKYQRGGPQTIQACPAKTPASLIWKRCWLAPRSAGRRCLDGPDVMEEAASFVRIWACQGISAVSNSEDTVKRVFPLLACVTVVIASLVTVRAQSGGAAPAKPSATAPQAPSSQASKPQSAPAATKDRLSADTFSGLALRGIGPAVTSGRVVDIAVDPDERTTWYVAVASAASGRPRTPAPRGRRSSTTRARSRSAASPSTRATRTSSGSARARTTASAASSYGDGVYRSTTAARLEELGLKESSTSAGSSSTRATRTSSTWPRRARSGRRAATAASTRRPTAARPGSRC